MLDCRYSGEDEIVPGDGTSDEVHSRPGAAARETTGVGDKCCPPRLCPISNERCQSAGHRVEEDGARRLETITGQCGSQNPCQVYQILV